MSLITSIFSGIQQRNAAKDAEKAQVDAAGQAGATYTNAVNEVNPKILSAAQIAGEGVTNAAGKYGGDVINAGNDAATGATNAATDSSGRVIGAAATAKTGVDTATVDANKLLDPYSKTGGQAATTLGDMLGPNGELMQKFSGVTMENDPGYQFRLQQGQQAQERAASAHGSSQGGGIMKALARYSQGVASSEYQNAFDRFQKQQDSTFSRLSDVSKIGLTAGTTQGANLIGAGKYGGDITTDAEKTAGVFNTNAAQYSGTAKTHAQEVAGGWGTDAAKYTGTANTRAAEVTSANTIGGAEFLANTQLGIGNAKASGSIARANAWSGMLSGIGGVADMALGAGMGGTTLGSVFGGVGAKKQSLKYLSGQ